MDSGLLCPSCKKIILPTDVFCAACGTKLKEELQPVSVRRQWTIYAVSFFLPPFGLFPAIRLLKQKDAKAKKVGLLAIALTVVSILLSVWLTVSFTKSLNREVNRQLDQYGIDF